MLCYEIPAKQTEVCSIGEKFTKRHLHRIIKRQDGNSMNMDGLSWKNLRWFIGKSVKRSVVQKKIYAKFIIYSSND